MNPLKAATSLLTICTFLILFSSCTRNTEPGKARLQVYLTDNPGDFESVFIDVKDVRINYGSDTSSGWQSLPGVATGIYDLLTLVNGQEALLADAEVNTGRIQQIRLVLGPNNSVKLLNGQTYNLSTPSAQQSGLKINIHQNVNEGIQYNLILDFDVAKSIVKQGNGNYRLKPVIRAVLEAAGGSVRGVVMPNSQTTSIYAIRNVNDTVASTATGTNGGYMIKGLDAGNYKLSFVPSDQTLNTTERNNIIVSTNNVTVVDSVFLQ